MWSGLMMLTAVTVLPSAQAQPGAAGASQAAAGGQSSGELVQVEIKREPLRLTDPQEYRVGLQLEPLKSLKLASPIDGIVRIVHFEVGGKPESQSEAVLLDNRAQQLVVDRATALLKAAQIELKQAMKGDADAVELAQARLDAAKADLDLAKLRLEQTSIRTPFPGTVFGMHVVEGQFVRAGEPVLTLGEAAQLKVVLPVDRTQVAVDQMIEVRVEDQTVQGRVVNILPPKPEFEPLRELAASIATAVVTIDNKSGRLHVGQTVYSPLVPRQPVAEIATACLSNLPTGRRRVQVVRDQVVRDVVVDLLGQVGPERIFVSGAFGEGDEIIVSSSQELADGTQIRPNAALADRAGSSRETSRPAGGAGRPATKPAAKAQPGF
jgi:membrane fusion protein, multidrug efflux system